jgi:FMN reductase
LPTRPIQILGMGGSLRRPSNSLSALRIALDSAAESGAITNLIPASELVFPFFEPNIPFGELMPSVLRMLELVRWADALLLSTPSYHGCMSGLVKNALDYFEYLKADEPPYLGQIPVGVISVGSGVTGVVHALDAAIGTIQALRGITAPVFAPLFLADQLFDSEGNCIEVRTEARLHALAEEVLRLARCPRDSRRA